VIQALGSKQEATATDPSWMTRSLASDLPDGELEAEPSRAEPAPKPERKPVVEKGETIVEPAAVALEVPIEPARKRKPSSKQKPNPADEFKQDNPYE
jgi:hypothetical protein